MADVPAPSEADELVKLAEARFADLTEAEKKLLHAVSRGGFAICGPSLNDKDPANDPSKADAWGLERSIRADLVRWLCVDRDAKTRVDPKGLRVYAARIDGPLDLSFVAVPFSLSFLRCRLVDNVELTRFEIPGLYLSGSWVRSISADGATVKGNVFLRSGFHAEGVVRLLGAQIGGDLDCSSGTFKNPPEENAADSGVALHADRLHVAGSLFLRDGFSAEGEVRLLGAQVGGNLDCRGGTFRNPPIEKVDNSGKVLSADGVTVRGDVFLNNGFSAEGEVRLLGAQIGGDLVCAAGTFKNPPQENAADSGKALHADRINVTGGVFLNNSFRAEGEVRLLDATVGGSLACIGGTFTGLNIETAAIKGNLLWAQVRDAKRTKLDLINASVGAIVDDEASWPVQGNLLLDGFVYGRITVSTTKANERIKWLGLQKDFTPQPYRQLAKVLKEAGDDKGAQSVLFEMEHRRRTREDLTWYAQLASWILRTTIGYGFYPLWALWRLTELTAVGCLLFTMGYFSGAIAPAQKEAYDFFQVHQRPPEYYEGFHALIYSVESTFPLVQLGQAERWQPEPNPQQHSCPPLYSVSGLSCRVASPVVIKWFRWCQIILGWVLTSFFVAGVTGIVRRD